MPNVSRLIQGIDPLIIEFMIRTWRITSTKNVELELPDTSSLDAVTRQLPEGFYTTFRTYDGCTRVIGLTRHLKRLPEVDASSLRRQWVTLLQPYGAGEARLRAMVTKQGKVYVSIEPLTPLPQEVYENGVRLETTSLQRSDPRTKSTAFIAASDFERKHIARAGIFEALLTKNGRILEGMTSNFFYVGQAGGVPYLGTAQRDVLPGVTRMMVIHAARGRGVEVRYRALKLDQLPAAKEAFITSSSRGIVPVIQIDDVTVGQGRVGEITKMLMQAYEDYVLTHAEKIAQPQ